MRTLNGTSSIQVALHDQSARDGNSVRTAGTLLICPHHRSEEHAPGHSDKVWQAHACVGQAGPHRLPLAALSVREKLVTPFQRHNNTGQRSVTTGPRISKGVFCHQGEKRYLVLEGNGCLSQRAEGDGSVDQASDAGSGHDLTVPKFEPPHRALCSQSPEPASDPLSPLSLPLPCSRTLALSQKYINLKKST